MDLPDTILLEIFSHISISERWGVVSVCKTWYNVCHDPYLYKSIELKDLEYKTLVLSLKKLVSIAPRIQSLTIEGCYSKVVQNTIVPVRFSNRANNSGPMLFSHISALQPSRKREEYIKHNFNLHDQFSDYLNQLLAISENNLINLVVQNCTLDLEMTDLFCIIPSHCRSLETFTYSNNHDKGIHSSGLLQAIVIACPKMRHFRGLHSGMDNAVVLSISRYWKSLQSLTLCSLKSCDILGQAEIISVGQQLTGSSPTGRISSHALWQLICQCENLCTLELDDLVCVSNRDLAMFENMKNLYRVPRKGENASIKNLLPKRFSPYHISKSLFTKNHHSATPKLPGSSIRQIIITKYMTTPLSKPGFESLFKLFPKLNRLEYETNFYTFNNLFEGISQKMFNAECAAVKEWCDQHKDTLEYIGQWDAKMTTEQRLMAGIASVSESN